jgi:hypothetical protein
MTSKRTKLLKKPWIKNSSPVASEEESENYPELFYFFYDSGADLNDRREGL